MLCFLRSVELQHGHIVQNIKEMGAKLADFAVDHPSQRFTLEEVADSQDLLGYFAPYVLGIMAPASSTGRTLAELQLYLDYNVLESITKLLEGLVLVCISTHLDDVCQKARGVYSSALAALTTIVEQARAQTTPQGKAIAWKLLDQLQPENHEQAPGKPLGLG
jgi:hypothetical protein